MEPSPKTCAGASDGGGVFAGVCAFLPDGIGAKRLQIFVSKLGEEGGQQSSTVNEATTHVISIACRHIVGKFRVDDATEWSRMCSSVKMVSFDWMSACLRHNRKVPEEKYILDCASEPFHSSPVALDSNVRPHPGVLVPNVAARKRLFKFIEEQNRKPIKKFHNNPRFALSRLD